MKLSELTTIELRRKADYLILKLKLIELELAKRTIKEIRKEQEQKKLKN